MQFAKSESPGNVTIIMHQQVVMQAAKHMPPDHPMYWTQSEERKVASKELNIPVYKYFVPNIQDYNDRNEYKY